ncbi:MAG: tRNA (adenosine(37)-N6)-threonylcarbamoyltransferase complex ATPase subunit type 1 TsaE [bacterium]
MIITTHSAEETKEEARKFLETVQPGTVVALVGDLGSGKTTFTQGIAVGLGIREPVISPTFVVMKIYKTKHERIKQLVHIDGYRLRGEEEIKLRQLDEYLRVADGIVLVEWPERFGELLKADRTVVFELGEKENERQIEIKHP